MPLARGRQANLSKMTPKERGTTLGKFRSEYIVYGDFLCEEPYVLAALQAERDARDGSNMAELRANEFDELSSSEEDDVDDE